MTDETQNLLKKIITLFKLEMVLDKTFDLILIFLGLFAALTLNNYIEENKQINDYKKDLTNLYNEVYENTVKLKYTDNSIYNINQFIHKIRNNYINNSLNDIADYEVANYHYVSPVYFKDIYFNSLNKDAFRNKNILSELRMNYDRISNIQNSVNTYNKNLENTSENLVYIKVSPAREDVLKLGHLVNKMLLMYDNDIFINSHNTSESLSRLLNSLENELKEYNISVNQIFNAEDYTNLAWQYLNINFDSSIFFSNKALKTYEEKNMNEIKLKGRIYQCLGISYYYKYSQDSKIVNLNEAISKFLIANELKHDVKFTPLFLSTCYYQKKDYEKAYSYLETSLKNGFNNIDVMQSMFIINIKNDKKISELLAQYGVLK